MGNKKPAAVSQAKKPEVNGGGLKLLVGDDEFQDEIKFIVRHTIVIILILFSLYLVHLIVQWLFGKDAALLKQIKVEYIIDVADLILLTNYVVNLILAVVKVTIQRFRRML